MYIEDRTNNFLLQELKELRTGFVTLEQQNEELRRINKELQGIEELLRLILTLSTNFIILSPDDIDDGINDVLKAIGSFAKVDRSYVFQFDKNATKMKNTHEWCSAGTQPQIKNLQNITAEEIPWLSERIKKYEVVHIPDVTELPLEATAEKREFMKQDIQSLIVVPIVSDCSIVGFLGFDSVYSKKIWSENIISLLKIVGEIFAFALSRKQMLEALRENESKYRALFEHASDAILLVKDDIFVDCNTRTLAIFKCTREQIVEQSLRRFLPQAQPDNIDSGEELIKKFRSAVNGEPQDFEWKYCRHDGTAFNAEVSLNRVLLGGEVFVQAIIRDVTERKIAEDLFRTMANSSPAGVYIIQKGKFQFVNPFFRQITGYGEEDMMGRESLTLIVGEEREAVKNSTAMMLQDKCMTAFQFRIFTKTGEVKWILSTVTSIQYKGKPAVLGSFIDITEHKQIEMQLKESEERYRILTEKSLVGVYMVQDNVFKYVNPAFAHIHGCEPVEMIGIKGPMDFIAVKDQKKLMESINMRKNGEIEGALVELSIIRKDGEIRMVEVYGSRAIYNGRAAELGTLLDVTEKKELEERLHIMSMKDELTNLYNRRGFLTVSDQQIKVASRLMKEALFCFIDLDGMKWINDTLGHRKGDEALVMTAKILHDTFRESDVIGRIGGDEFAVLAFGANDSYLDLLVNRLQNNVEKFNSQEDRGYKLSLSIGSASYDPENPRSIDELMSRADMHMYEEKKEKYQRKKMPGVTQ